MPGRVELRTPNFVQGLVLSPPEGHGRSKSHVEVAEILKSFHQSFGVELWPVPFQRFDQDAAREVAFKGHIVRRLSGEVFVERGFVIEDHRGVAVDRRHHLGHDDPRRVLLPQEHQLASQSSATNEGDTRVDHAWIKIAGLLDESRRSPVSRYHDHRFYRNAALFELCDRLIYIYCIALVIETQNCALFASLQ